MYCKHCGNFMDAKAAFCTRCGSAAGSGEHFCQNCGQETLPEAQVCTACGHLLHQARDQYQGQYQGQYQQQSPPPYSGAGGYPMQKSRIAAGVLGIVLGSLGIHNFYLGHTGRGLVQLLVSVLTCGVGAAFMAVWGLVEGIMLLCGSTNFDARGLPLRD